MAVFLAFLAACGSSLPRSEQRVLDRGLLAVVTDQRVHGLVRPVHGRPACLDLGKGSRMTPAVAEPAEGIDSPARRRPRPDHLRIGADARLSRSWPRDGIRGSHRRR